MSIRRTEQRRLGWVLGAMVFWLASAGMATDPEPDASTGPPGQIEFIGKNLFATANGTFHRWEIVESELDPDALAESFAVVRVDLEFSDAGVSRHVAIYFDGGAPPSNCVA